MNIVVIALIVLVAIGIIGAIGQARGFDLSRAPRRAGRLVSWRRDRRGPPDR
jgi:hypothetical protein